MSNSTFTLSTLLPATLLALTTVACVSEENDPGALEFRTTVPCNPLTPNCDPDNSPNVNSHSIAEFKKDGTPNADGLWISGIKSPANVTYTLGTHGQELAAYNGNTVVARGPGLVGYKLVVHHPDGVQNATIEAVDRTISPWASNGHMMSAYAISYTLPNNPAGPVNVCPEFYNNPGAPVATVIVGETYDRELKTVNPNMPGWVTLACSAEAAYKAKRMNYDSLANFDGLGNPATPDQRQATIKMITADYCGGGLSFTTQGRKLLWKNRSGTVNTYTTTFQTGTGPVQATPELEAIWGEHGALCFNKPRHPEKWADVLEDNDIPMCPLPDCSTIDLVNDDYEWITWVMPTFE